MKEKLARIGPPYRRLACGPGTRHSKSIGWHSLPQRLFHVLRSPRKLAQHFSIITWVNLVLYHNKQLYYDTPFLRNFGHHRGCDGWLVSLCGTPFLPNVLNITNYTSIERKYIHLRYQNNIRIVVCTLEPYILTPRFSLEYITRIYKELQRARMARGDDKRFL